MALHLDLDINTEFRSRACDDEGIEEAVYAPIFRWSEIGRGKLRQLKQDKFEPQNMFIGTEIVSSTWLQKCFSNFQTYATLILPETELKGLHLGSTVAKTCNIMSDDNGKSFVVCCSIFVDPNRVWDWVFSLFSKIQPKRIHMFGTMLSMPFETRENTVFNEGVYDQQVLLLRKILSTKALENESIDVTGRIPFLESPQMINGLLAGLLSYCQIHRLEAVAILGLHSSNFEIMEGLRAFDNSELLCPMRKLLENACGNPLNLVDRVSKIHIKNDSDLYNRRPEIHLYS